MKIRYLLTMALGASITLTSCKPAEPDKRTATKATQTVDFNQFKVKGEVVTLEQLGAYFSSPDEAFNAALQSGSVVVDFYADWCPPCQQMIPNFKKAAEQLSRQLNVLFVKINIDRYPSITDRYYIKNIPALVFFKMGSIIKRNAGLLSERALSNMVSATF